MRMVGRRRKMVMTMFNVRLYHPEGAYRGGEGATEGE